MGWPAHEGMQAAKAAGGVVAGAEEEVIGVTQDDTRPTGQQVARAQRLDRGLGVIGTATGVSKVPCRVWSCPRRAWLCASGGRRSKVSGIAGFPPQRSSKTSLRKIFETRKFTAEKRGV